MLFLSPLPHHHPVCDILLPGWTETSAQVHPCGTQCGVSRAVRDHCPLPAASSGLLELSSLALSQPRPARAPFRPLLSPPSAGPSAPSSLLPLSCLLAHSLPITLQTVLVLGPWRGLSLPSSSLCHLLCSTSRTPLSLPPRVLHGQLFIRSRVNAPVPGGDTWHSQTGKLEEGSAKPRRTGTRTETAGRGRGTIPGAEGGGSQERGRGHTHPSRVHSLCHHVEPPGQLSRPPPYLQDILKGTPCTLHLGWRLLCTSHLQHPASARGLRHLAHPGRPPT